jgi:sporulation protein YlmC with PRC-barrel domain
LKIIPVIAVRALEAAPLSGLMMEHLLHKPWVLTNHNAKEEPMKRPNLATAVAIALAAPAAAQMDTQSYPEFEPGQELKNGYSAEELRDARLHGKDGKKIGEVEDVIIEDGKLERLVVTVNEGLFGTGGRRLAVDWEDVQVGERDGYEIENITVDVAERDVERSDLFTGTKDAIRGGKNEWRATELIGDDVDFEDSMDDGYVSDIMFSQNGELRAVAATADLDGSVLNFYAPYSSDGWEPGDDFFVVPHTQQELRELLPEAATQAAN